MISRINTILTAFNGLLDALKTVNGKRPELKVPYFYTVYAVVDALNIAFGNISPESLASRCEPDICERDNTYQERYDYSKEENTIYVQQGLPGQEIFKALLGEILTARLERSDNPDNKFFVEPVAYILCKRNGIDPPTISDATMLSGTESRSIRKLLEVVRNEANNMSNTMERTLHPKDRGER